MKGSHTHCFWAQVVKGWEMSKKAAVCLGVTQIKDIKHLSRLCSDFMTMGGSH